MDVIYVVMYHSWVYSHFGSVNKPEVFRTLESATKDALNHVDEINAPLDPSDGDYMILMDDYSDMANGLFVELKSKTLNYVAVSRDRSSAIWINKQKVKM